MTEPTPAPKLVSSRLTFAQEADCCGPNGDDSNLLHLETFNGTGDASDQYVVIETERWAVDPSNIDWLIVQLCKMGCAKTRRGEVSPWMFLVDRLWDLRGNLSDHDVQRLEDIRTALGIIDEDGDMGRETGT